MAARGIIEHDREVQPIGDARQTGNSKGAEFNLGGAPTSMSGDDSRLSSLPISNLPGEQENCIRLPQPSKLRFDTKEEVLNALIKALGEERTDHAVVLMQQNWQIFKEGMREIFVRVPDNEYWAEMLKFVQKLGMKESSEVFNTCLDIEMTILKELERRGCLTIFYNDPESIEHNGASASCKVDQLSEERETTQEQLVCCPTEGDSTDLESDGVGTSEENSSSATGNNDSFDGMKLTYNEKKLSPQEELAQSLNAAFDKKDEAAAVAAVRRCAGNLSEEELRSTLSSVASEENNKKEFSKLAYNVMYEATERDKADRVAFVLDLCREKAIDLDHRSPELIKRSWNASNKAVYAKLVKAGIGHKDCNLGKDINKSIRESQNALIEVLEPICEAMEKYKPLNNPLSNILISMLLDLDRMTSISTNTFDKVIMSGSERLVELVIKIKGLAKQSTFYVDRYHRTSAAPESEVCYTEAYTKTGWYINTIDKITKRKFDESECDPSKYQDSSGLKTAIDYENPYAVELLLKYGCAVPTEIMKKKKNLLSSDKNALEYADKRLKEAKEKQTPYIEKRQKIVDALSEKNGGNKKSKKAK